MPHPLEPPHDPAETAARDARVVRSRRVRVAVVSAGVVGSLGVAGGVALTAAEQSPSLSQGSAAGVGAGSQDGSSFSHWQQSRSQRTQGQQTRPGSREGDDGEGDDGAGDDGGGRPPQQQPNQQPNQQPQQQPQQQPNQQPNQQGPLAQQPPQLQPGSGMPHGGTSGS